MSVLDLPIEKQNELAAKMGQSHSDWMVGVKARSIRSKQFAKEIRSGESDLSPEEAKRFQLKMDSANPPDGKNITI